MIEHVALAISLALNLLLIPSAIRWAVAIGAVAWIEYEKWQHRRGNGITF